MRRKKLCLFIITSVALFGQLTQYCNAYSYEIYYLATDDNLYYIDENIEINSSWQLTYNEAIELSFLQIHITDISDMILWNSSIYEQVGFYEGQWIINISELPLNLETSYCILKVKLFYYYLNFYSSQTFQYYVEEIEIQVSKRNLSCQLIGFKDILNKGDYLNFSAKFYIGALENNIHLANQLISFSIVSDNKTIINAIHLTSLEGIIEINISTVEVDIGYYDIYFSVNSSQLYNSAIFKYNLQITETFTTKILSDETIVLIFCSVLIIFLTITGVIYMRFRTKHKKIGGLAIEL
ncbi:MAG: hypothetical protein ACFFAS_18485 [Promethearchaeota archaeon]